MTKLTTMFKRNCTATPATPRRAAFTLLEVLIAVGALGLIALGLSQIFRATGETVKAGRRLSNLNTFASLIESQLRRDFASMTRDGFLMIRNEEVEGQHGTIELYEGQPGPQQRPRRVDEIVFFATGDFVTLRPPVHPSRIARAQAARIYIGHGLRWHPLDPDTAKRVKLDNRMDEANPLTGDTTEGVNKRPPAPFGFRHDPVLRGPNEFAADWMLLRHVTLLSPPSQIRPELQPAASSGLTTTNQVDSPFQVALQPAVRSIFRGFARQVGTEPDAGEWVRGVRGVRPRFDCGVVDIATTDLSEIRALLTAIASDKPDWSDPPTGDGLRIALGGTLPVTWPDSHPRNLGAAQDMHNWMKDALPANSDYPVLNNGGRGGRMRAEPKAPNPLGYGSSFAPAAQPLLLDIQRADQLMLASSVFVPSCSEFIVEWSFGKRFPTSHPDFPGELIWHGMERQIDRNGNGTLETSEVVADVYDQTDTYGQYQQKYFKKDGTLGMYLVQDGLIHYQTVIPGVEYSFFGYNNPTFAAPTNSNDPATIPWPWPRLIRITMTLVDPTDRQTEQTYQFIFETPGSPGDTQF